MDRCIIIIIISINILACKKTELQNQCDTKHFAVQSFWQTQSGLNTFQNPLWPCQSDTFYLNVNCDTFNFFSTCDSISDDIVIAQNDTLYFNESIRIAGLKIYAGYPYHIYYDSMPNNQYTFLSTALPDQTVQAVTYIQK